MKKTTIVLLAVCLATFAGAAPAAAEEPTNDPVNVMDCVWIFLDPPDVFIDPSCIDPDENPG